MHLKIKTDMDYTLEDILILIGFDKESSFVKSCKNIKSMKYSSSYCRFIFPKREVERLWWYEEDPYRANSSNKDYSRIGNMNDFWKKFWIDLIDLLADSAKEDEFFNKYKFLPIEILS